MRGIGESSSNLELYDFTQKKKMPRFSSESSALHCIKDVVTFASSALKNQILLNLILANENIRGNFFPRKEKFSFHLNSSFKERIWVHVLTIAFF